MTLVFSAADLVNLLAPRATRGATAATICQIAALKDAEPGDLSFLGNPKYKPEVAATRASVVLLPADFEGEPPADQLWLLVDNPSASLATLCARLEAALWPRPAAGIHPSAVIDPSASVDPTATVGPLCVVEAGVQVGPRTVLQAQVFIGRAARVGAECWFMPGVHLATETLVGDRVKLQAGVVLGSDGFGYESSTGRHIKIPQVGQVVIADDVEIGANTTIDRARFSRTYVGAGTKIDNLVMIGHNVVIGRHCILCAQVGISGSTTLEDYVVLGGQAGIAGHLLLKKGAKTDGQTGVNRDLEPGVFVKGSPCLPFQLEQRINILRQRLPDLFRKVDTLAAELAELKARV
ncbi:MAG: UDP-3-O-(3-hydroxymyristoyl)glucosamine N-acyltransferase [Burkholderiales bacterium]|nr:UDP-3-O-(3-hydroxymyristoyl)glucosamine N-acyltransferase [Opitutaceae bacterium]